MRRWVPLAAMWVFGCGGASVPRSEVSAPVVVEPIGEASSPEPVAARLQIVVDAPRWVWRFRYRDELVSGALHVPRDEPVRVVLRAAPGATPAVLAVPELNIAWRLPAQGEKVVLHRFAQVGEWDLLNGDASDPMNADMRAKLIVEEPSRFAAWRQDMVMGPEPSVAAGETLYRQLGCHSCHSIDGSPRVGPSLQGLYARVRQGEVVAEDGTRLGDVMGASGRFADADDYVRKQLDDPKSFVRQGFAPVMPTYQGRFRPNDGPALLMFLRSLEAQRP